MCGLAAAVSFKWQLAGPEQKLLPTALYIVILSHFSPLNFVMQDKSLTKEEILNHQDLFVGSRATNYGNYMKHDEF